MSELHFSENSRDSVALSTYQGNASQLVPVARVASCWVPSFLRSVYVLLHPVAAEKCEKGQWRTGTVIISGHLVISLHCGLTFGWVLESKSKLVGLLHGLGWRTVHKEITGLRCTSLLASPVGVPRTKRVPSGTKKFLAQVSWRSSLRGLWGQAQAPCIFLQEKALG